MGNASRPMKVFAVGDEVCLSSMSRECLSRLHLKDDGVYVVVEAREVPNKCNCGRLLPDCDHGCPYSQMDPRYGRRLRELVGHDQWLMVHPKDKTHPLPSHLQFSGAWFTRANT